MAGIAVASRLVTRTTDTNHRERVERAKKAPVIVTNEHQAQRAVQQQVNVGEDAIRAANGGGGEEGPRA